MTAPTPEEVHEYRSEDGWFESGDRCVWYLARRPLKIRVVSFPQERDRYTGGISGIQRAPREEVESLWPSSKCPICLRETPHAHGEAELERLRRMVRYLEQKLGEPSDD
jgi:hypothetical protein